MSTTQTSITSYMDANKKKLATYAMLAGIIIGGVLAVWTVFSTPSEVRAVQARMYQITQESERLQAQVAQAQVEWAQVDIAHQDLLAQIAELENQKRTISARAEGWRKEYETLQKERSTVAMELAGFLVGR